MYFRRSGDRSGPFEAYHAETTTVQLCRLRRGLPANNPVMVIQCVLHDTPDPCGLDPGAFRTISIDEEYL